MAILHGHFAMMLIVSSPKDIYAQDLELSLTELSSELGLTIVARPLDDSVLAPASSGENTGESAESQPGKEWYINAYGQDRVGIVHAVSTCLAEHSVNILNLRTQLSSGSTKAVYAMVIHAQGPATLDESELQDALSIVAGKLNIQISASPVEDSTL